MKSILSLDISSSAIGWAVISFDADYKLLDYGSILPSKKIKNIQERFEDLESKLSKLVSANNYDYIVVEDYASFFKGGRSNSRTIIILALFNEFTKYFLYKKTGVLPEKISVISIRSILSKKFSKKIRSKDETFEFIKENEPGFSVRLNRNNNIRKECYDEADAIATGIAYYFKLTEV